MNNLKLNPNQHITEYVDYYLNLKKSPEYAILLRGKWGSGKSWYINNLISNSGHEFIYVSLNGVTSYKEIEDSFFQQLHPVLSSREMKLAGRILKGVIRTTIKIDLNGDDKSDLSLTSSIPNGGLEGNFKKLNDRILIFDDLERCPIRIEDILGYITQFVEYQGLKVILLANESEILENENNGCAGSCDNKYLRIKEKLIARSFDITIDFDSAFDSFKGGIENQRIEELFDKYKFLVKDVFVTASYDNLRHLKQSIIDFERFYHFLPEEAFSKDVIVEHILYLFFSISFEIRKGEITEKMIPDLFLIDALAKKEGAPSTAEQKIRNKYSVFKEYHHPFDFTYWVQYFRFGTVNKERFKESILECRYFQEENTPNWIKLWEFYNLNDDDYDVISKEVLERFRKKKIEDKYELIHVTGILLTLSKNKLIHIKSTEVVKLGKKNIDNLSNKGFLKLNKNEDFPSTSMYGMAYQNYGESDFMDFLKYAKNEVSKARLGDVSTESVDLLELMNSSINDFKEKLVFSHSDNSLYYDIPILKHLEIDSFINSFLNLSNYQKRIFGEIVKKRYSNSSFNEVLKEEKEWLFEFKTELCKRSKKMKGKISKILIVENIIPEIDNAITALDV